MSPRVWLTHRLGTQVHLHRGRLWCVDCGTRIPYRTLTGRWAHSACSSCDDYLTTTRATT